MSQRRGAAKPERAQIRIHAHVKWLDPATASDNWMTLDEAVKAVPEVNYSCGYLLKDQKDGMVRLALTQGANGLVSDVLVIPRSLILAMRQVHSEW